MKEAAGKVFSICRENRPAAGCTISNAVSADNGYFLSHFALAEGTNISAEIYRYPKLWIVAGGALTMNVKGGEDRNLQKGDLAVTPVNVPVGVTAKTDAVYTELTLKEDSKMNEILKAGKVFSLKEMVPYQEGRIVNMDLVNDEKLKFVIMSFTKGTALPEHAAPGDALIFALDGEGIIGYEGEEHVIRAGENFRFAKGGAHYVKADQNFKMALLLTL